MAQPRRCTRCTEEAQNVSHQASKELAMIRENAKLELDDANQGLGCITFTYPEIRPLDELRDIKFQAVGFQAHLERELEQQERREEYNSNSTSMLTQECSGGYRTRKLWHGGVLYTI